MLRSFQIVLIGVLLVLTPSAAYAQSTPVALGTPVASGKWEVRGSDRFPIAGNAFDLLDEGVAGELTAVAVGAPGPWIPVIVHNGTTETLQQPTVGIEARSASGELLAVGSTDEVVPFLLEPNGFGIASVNMGTEIEWTDDIVLSLDLGGVTSDFEDDFPQGMSLVEYNPDLGVGSILNSSDYTLGNFFLRFACFDENGKLGPVEFGSAASQELAAGDTSGFDLLMTGSGGCARFILIASGGNYG